MGFLKSRWETSLIRWLMIHWLATLYQLLAERESCVIRGTVAARVVVTEPFIILVVLTYRSFFWLFTVRVQKQT